MHHAGLTLDDRRAVEDLYINKILRVVVATSVRLVFFFSHLFVDPDSYHSDVGCWRQLT